MGIEFNVNKPFTPVTNRFVECVQPRQGIALFFVARLLFSLRVCFLVVMPAVVSLGDKPR